MWQRCTWVNHPPQPLRIEMGVAQFYSSGHCDLPGCQQRDKCIAKRRQVR